jgi:hypothetical protein
MTVAAMAMALMKVWAQRSNLVAMRRQSFSLAPQLQLASPTRRNRIGNTNQPTRLGRGRPVEASQLTLDK